MREVIASSISIGAIGGLYKKQPPTYSTQHLPKFRDRISFQNQDGLNTTHTTAQPQSAGCGGNMSSRSTMLLVFNRGGPGSYRERRGVMSQKETQFYSKAQQIPRSLNQYLQNNRVRSKTTHKARQALPACCGGKVR